MHFSFLAKSLLANTLVIVPVMLYGLLTDTQRAEPISALAFLAIVSLAVMASESITVLVALSVQNVNREITRQHAQKG